MKQVTRRLNYLTEREVQKVHKAACQLLENTGIELRHESAKQELINAGAQEEDQRLLIPKEMVEEAIERAPSGFKLYDQKGKNPKELQVGNVLFGSGSDSLYVTDWQTNQVRETQLSDLIDLVKVADALPEYDFIMSMGLPKGVPQQELYGIVFREMVTHSDKPIIATSTSFSALKQAYKVARTVSGSEKTFKEKPFFISYLEPESPLKFPEPLIERLWFSGEKGIPTMSTSAASMGALAPVTFEGAVVQGAAESLAGLVLLQQKHPGAKFIFGANISALDLRTSIDAYGAPESNMANAVYADMGEFYNLPSWGIGGCADSHRLDVQAGEEAFQSILLGLQSGSTIVHDVGYLAYGSLYDARFLVLANEMIARAKWTWRDFRTTEDAFALDIIDDVLSSSVSGSGASSFINHPHTAKKCREEIYTPPKYFERGRIGPNQQGKPILEKLSSEVEDILSSAPERKIDSAEYKELEQMSF